jgi:anaerobic dimethyl sulfoxide reductase subunit B (iron-sulfur subunit)
MDRGVNGRAAFYFDSSACSGCKACQVACKDKNQLPVGVMWRRVYEVSGGGWQAQDGAWRNDVFAYNLSIACNHCVHPKCAGVCPVDAYTVRPDGIVLLDGFKCMGCGYCSWACPYGAPQYDAAAGRMSKCNYCYDAVDAGLPPACVAACPLRVLNTAGQVEQPAGYIHATPQASPYPLPEVSRTEPNLYIKPHIAAARARQGAAYINREEFRPRQTKGEGSLIAFTLLTQAAVGMAWFTAWLGLPGLPRAVPLLLIGLLLGAGGLASFLHLGSRHNAWRALNHLRKSWLSREILMAGVFAALWALNLLVGAAWAGWLLAAAGAGLVYSMARVYALRAVPGWTFWRSGTAFLGSALLLGGSGWAALALLGGEAPALSAWLAPALCLPLLLLWLERGVGRRRVQLARLALILLAALALAGSAWSGALLIPALGAVSAEETLGRWLFYHRLEQRAMI